jgi:nucleotide-binding universal stress UspA family protein
MYRKILVPLDGSELAECVLPHVESIVKGCQVPDLIFIRVVEPVHLPVGTLTDGGSVYTEAEAEATRKQSDAMNKADAENYLKGVMGRSKYGNARTQSVVLSGKAAETVAEYAEKNGVDLVVIATHGRSGVSRWVWGSTADKVLRSACVPVLMIRAPGCIPGI